MRNNPRDKSKPKKAFAAAQSTGTVSLEEFAQHMTTHGCVYSRGDIYGILSQAVDCIKEFMLQGKIVELGELGKFRITLSSVGAESASLFSAANITKVNVIWAKGDTFQNLRDEAAFNLVANKETTAVVVGALKDGIDVTAKLASPVNTEPDENGGTTGV